VSIDGTQVACDGIVLDGHNAATVALEVPGMADGSIFGTVANGGGRLIRLLLPPVSSPLIEMRADAAGRYASTSYSQRLHRAGDSERPSDRRGARTDDRRSGRRDGRAGRFALIAAAALGNGRPSRRWRAGPGFSVVRCQVQGEQGARCGCGRQVGRVSRNASAANRSMDGCCEFAPLGPGRYFIEPVGLETGTGHHCAQRSTWAPTGSAGCVSPRPPSRCTGRAASAGPAAQAQRHAAD